MRNRFLVTAAFVLVAIHSAHAVASGDAKAGETKAKQICAACHGEDGNSIVPNFPNLAAQVPGYIATQLALFKSGGRESAQMVAFAGTLTETDMADLDAYYSSQKSKGGSIPEAERELAKRGERLYRGGYASMEIAACIGCHGPSGHGVPRLYPRVAGQKRQYLTEQLVAFKEGKRKSDGDIMTDIAFRLSRQQIDDLVMYMHSLD